MLTSMKNVLNNKGKNEILHAQRTVYKAYGFADNKQ
jgi:hypothetical protein